MVNFEQITANEFLEKYWQKKPLVIRQALPGFTNTLSPDELAGLALEEEIESRLVLKNDIAPFWHLKRGPFDENDFNQLPDKNWTLLVQGVDRFIPEVADLLEHFNFIPQWRIDDVMISYAVDQGSVGPHYDNYDVFLYQAKGRRKWMLTSQHCVPENYLPNVDLRIMDQFVVEQEFILEEGDMLYIPPHIGHYGISFSPECLTYSFGYRSYRTSELWQNLSDFFAENKSVDKLYKDPCWSNLKGSSQLTTEAINNAKQLLRDMLEDEKLLQQWFGCYVTQLDQQADYLLPDSEDTLDCSLEEFLQRVENNEYLNRNSLCRFAYQINEAPESWLLFINGRRWNTEGVSEALIKQVSDKYHLATSSLQQYLHHSENCQFLYELYLHQWLYFQEDE